MYIMLIIANHILIYFFKMEATASKTNALMTTINQWEGKTKLRFRPQKSFYKELGITRIRFWQIAKGEKGLSVDEARNLSAYFQISISNFF